METADMMKYRAIIPNIPQLIAKFTEQKAIDMTAFLGRWPTRYQSYASAADLTGMIDRYNLSGVCVSHIASIHGHDTRSGNAALLTECASDRRLWAFAILNPIEPGWKEELAWVIGSGARGIRLLPGFHRYELDHPDVAEFVQAVRKAGLPLQVFVRLQDERLQHPSYKVETVPLPALTKLAAALEGHPLLISGVREYEWEAMMKELPAGVQKEQMLFDLWYCKSPIAVIASLCRRGGAGSFVYGSGAPLHLPEATVMQLAVAGISEAERYTLCRGNALRFLGLSE